MGIFSCLFIVILLVHNKCQCTSLMLLHVKCSENRIDLIMNFRAYLSRSMRSIANVITDNDEKWRNVFLCSGQVIAPPHWFERYKNVYPIVQLHALQFSCFGSSCELVIHMVCCNEKIGCIWHVGIRSGEYRRLTELEIHVGLMAGWRQKLSFHPK